MGATFRIVMLAVDKYLYMLFHARIHRFHLAYCLQMEGCLHLSVNSQVVAYLATLCSGDLRSLIRSNCFWVSMEMSLLC